MGLRTWVNSNSGWQRREEGDKKDTGGMEELEGGVRSALSQENASEAERESLQDSSTTSHDVGHGGCTNQEGEREKNECVRDEDVEVDVQSYRKRQNT